MLPAAELTTTMATEILTQTSSTIQLPIKFSTQTRYVLPPQRFMLPASWRRRELSQLINKALALSSPVPFDFLVKGTLLRTSLEEWLQRTGTGTVCAYLVNELNLLTRV